MNLPGVNNSVDKKRKNPSNPGLAVPARKRVRMAGKVKASNDVNDDEIVKADGIVEEETIEVEEPAISTNFVEPFSTGLVNKAFADGTTGWFATDRSKECSLFSSLLHSDCIHAMDMSCFSAAKVSFCTKSSGGMLL